MMMVFGRAAPFITRCQLRQILVLEKTIRISHAVHQKALRISLRYDIYILYNYALGIRHILSVLTRYVYTPTLCNLYNNALGIRHTPLGIDYSIHNTASGVRHAVHQNALYDRQ